MPTRPQVLIVEDDDPTRSLLAAVVSHYGGVPVLAKDGDGAIAQLMNGEYTALVLDLLTPERNGFDVLRHMKCTRPEILPRTIVVTGACDATTRDCEELRLVRRVLPKPVVLDDFVADLRAVLFADDENQRSFPS